MRHVLLFAMVGLGCSASPAPGPPEPDPAVLTFALLRATPAIAPSLSAAAPLIRIGHAFHGPSGGALTTVIGARASGVVHLTNTSVDGAWIDLATEVEADVPASIEARGLAFPGASPDVDIAWVASAHHAEEARVLHAAGVHTARYRLGLGPAIAAARAREGRIECVDAAGKVLLGTAPVFAVDARGTRVELSPRVSSAGRVAEIVIALDARGLVPPIVLDPVWTTVSPVGKARISPGTVVLADGKILVSGGYESGTTPSSSAEVYDPVANTWTSVGATATTHYNHTLVRLPSGKVLLADYAPELYDPASKTWSLAGTSSYLGQVAFLAKTGKVVVFFHYGDTPGALAYTRLYDETTGTWSSGAPLPTPRGGTDAAMLPDGRILVVGGYDSNKGTSYSNADLYDPATDTWTVAPPRPVRAAYAGVLTLPSGKVFVAGGSIPLAGGTTKTHLFDPATGWTEAAPVPADVGRFSLIGPGRVLTFPASSSSAAASYVFDEASGKYWAASVAPVYPGSIVSIGGGKVLLPGGQFTTGAITTTTAIWQAATNGTTCAVDRVGDCASLFCADGVCCDKPCTGPCEQCAASGTTGTCTALTGTPHVGRTCAPFAGCSAGACASTCAADTDCVATAYCAGSCVARKPAGASCAATKECTTGATCVDGVCCTTSCGGQCEACDIPGYEGTCRPVVGAPRGARAACTDFAKECGQVCDGKTTATCVYLPADTRACGKNACAAGTETHAGTCDDKGACKDSPKSCGAYACGVASCLTACATKAECAAGRVCVSGACVPAPGLGGPCTLGTECSTEFCTDGVCCGLPSCGAGATCAAKGKAGTCTKLAGVACATNDECASSLCVDGVCCDSACTGQCEACDVPGLAGKCSPTRGKPRGSRAACGAGTGPCDAQLCDGKDTAACKGFLAAEVSCRDASCKDGKAVAPAACDGAGACPAVVEKPCGGYACDKDGVACRSDCTSDAHCVVDYRCKAGVCRPATATCSSDFTSRVGVDGVATSCAPYRCRAGDCPKTCGTSEDCISGTACADGACVASAPTGEGGGCTSSPSGRPSSLAAWAFFALLLVWRRARVGAFALLVGCSTRESPRELAHTVAPITVSGPTKYSYRSPPGVAIAGGDVLILDEISPRRERFLGSGTWKDVSTAASFTVGSTLSSGQAIVFSLTDTTPGAEKTATELFDATTNTWTTKAPPLKVHISGWTARLASGKLLLGHGRASVPSSTCTSAVELYDPTADTWTSVAPSAVPRCGAAVVTLPDGKVLVASGANTAGFVATAEVYDPVTNTWANVGDLNGPPMYPRGVLAGGKVLVVGGSAQLYDPVSKTWGILGDRTRAQPGVALLPSGRVLLVGGTGDNAVEVFDPTTLKFHAAGTSAFVRKETTAIRTTDDRVIIVGGSMDGVGSILEAEVWKEQPNGAACVADGECTSLHCVDGRCCDTACSGACQACNLAGKLGTCSAVTGVPAAGHPSCAPAASCVAGACKTSCAADADCCVTRDACCKVNTCSSTFVGAFCDGAACRETKAKGATCTRDAECVSGFCTDGVCCASACKGQCEACGEAATKGDCVAIKGAPRGARTACAGGGGACGLVCDGVSAKTCTFPPATTACGTASCAAGVETHASFCDGIGKCADIPKTCGAFACSGTTCATTCTTNVECATGFYCKAGACLPTPGLGQPCSATVPCLGALFCTEGVCCSEAACTSGKSCALPASKGTCAKVDGQSCTSDGECGSRTCVDGVCCEARCAGQCQACNEPGLAGKCVAVKGAPRGTRTACSTKAGSPCEATSCDGTDGARCASLAGVEVTCRESTCAKGTATAAGTCNGAGTCGAPVLVACAPYRCEGTACATKCATSDACADGFVCEGSACVKAKVRCSTDGTAVVDPEGKSTSCAPFLCRDAACIEACKSSADCAIGTACDGAGRCVPPDATPAAVDPGGGCGVAGRGAPASAWLSLLVLALRRRVVGRRGRGRIPPGETVRGFGAG